MSKTPKKSQEPIDSIEELEKEVLLVTGQLPPPDETKKDVSRSRDLAPFKTQSKDASQADMETLLS